MRDVCEHSSPEIAASKYHAWHAVGTLQVLASGLNESDIIDDSWQPSVRVPTSLTELLTGESEPPATPLGGPADTTAMPGVAGPATTPRLAFPAMRQTPMHLIVPSDGTVGGLSTSVVIELASLFTAAPVLSAGNLCQLRLRSDGGAQGLQDREFQGFE